MRSFTIAIIAVFIFIAVKANIGYFKYDGSARTSTQSINYQVGQ